MYVAKSGDIVRLVGSSFKLHGVHQEVAVYRLGASGNKLLFLEKGGLFQLSLFEKIGSRFQDYAIERDEDKTEEDTKVNEKKYMNVIEPEDIKKGDTVRAYPLSRKTNRVHTEYKARHNGDTYDFGSSNRYELIHREKPKLYLGAVLEDNRGARYVKVSHCEYQNAGGTGGYGVNFIENLRGVKILSEGVK